MKITLISLFLVLSFSVSAIEVGDQLPECKNFLQTRFPGGAEDKTCIENFNDKEFLMIEFMSIYCGSCIRALPVVNKIGNKYADKLMTAFVTLDRDDEGLEEFWNEYNSQIDHPLIFDKERTTRRPYMIKYTPTTILVTRDGTIIYKHVGEFDDNETKELESFLQ